MIPTPDMLRRHAGNPYYRAWHNMLTRCYNKGNKDFPRYGGRGIFVCESWRASFEAFVRDMGPKSNPELTLGREDNDGPYSPENCRWESRFIQARNRSTTRTLTIDGVTMTVKDWCDSAGVDDSTYAARVRKGQSPEVALRIARPKTS